MAEVGRPAPFFALEGVTGGKLSLTEFKGKVVMLEFFTYWCAPCQSSAPEVQWVYSKLKDKGLVVIGISLLDSYDAVRLQAFIKEHGLMYPIALDDREVSKIYGAYSIPTSFIIDRQGMIRNKHLGYQPNLGAILAREIETLL